MSIYLINNINKDDHLCYTILSYFSDLLLFFLMNLSFACMYLAILGSEVSNLSSFYFSDPIFRYKY